jgi:hypothetical protein
MQVLEMSAYPWQHLPGFILEQNGIKLYVWDMGTDGILIERQ